MLFGIGITQIQSVQFRHFHFLRDFLHTDIVETIEIKEIPQYP